MKRKVAVVLVLALALALAIASCAGVKKTEVAVTSYESVAIALRTAHVYLSEREKNGSLSGEALVKAKADYATARGKFLEAGEMLKTAVSSPVTFNQSVYVKLLEDAAKIAAALSKGGK